MQMQSQKQIIIGVTTLVCILLVGIAFTSIRRIGPSVAAQLPAERTLLVLSHFSINEQQVLQSIFSSLRGAPLKEEPTPIAALVASGDATEWVLFDAQGTPSTTQPLVQEGEASLLSDAAYLPLRSTYTTHVPWAFVRSPHTDAHLNGFTIPSHPITLSLGTGSISLAWATKTILQNGFMGPNVQDTSRLGFSIRATQLQPVLEGVFSVLSAQNQMVVRTLIESKVRTIFGADISARYDILPLLHGAGTFIAKEQTGSLIIGLRALPQSNQTEALDRLEQGITSALAGAERIQRTFDTTFTFDSLEASNKPVHTTSFLGMWEIHTTPFTPTLVARNGQEWIFGSTQEMAPPLIEATLPMSKEYIASGTINKKAMQNLLQNARISVQIPWQILLQKDENVAWSLQRQGDLAVLRISR